MRRDRDVCSKTIEEEEESDINQETGGRKAKMTGTGSRSEVQIMKHGRTRRARPVQEQDPSETHSRQDGRTLLSCCQVHARGGWSSGLREPSNSISMFRRRRFALVHRLHRNFTSKAWPIVGAHASRITRRHTRRLRFGLHRSLLDQTPTRFTSPASPRGISRAGTPLHDPKGTT